MKRRYKALDLFCCAGGASTGLHQAGFDVIGVDNRPQPRYPFKFVQADAMTYKLEGFDFIWASPPCQRYSDLAKRNGNADDHPDLVPAMVERLNKSKAKWVVENVEGAPLRRDLMLCGTMFPGLRVLRHRIFQANFRLKQPCHPDHPLVHTFDRRKYHFGKTDETVDFVQVTGGGNCTIAAASDAMGIDWMTKAEINEAIPPAYAHHIGVCALAALMS